MKIICDGADLSDAVLKVSKGTSNKTTNPILEGIKVVAEEDYVTLTATDLELSIEKTIKSLIGADRKSQAEAENSLYVELLDKALELQENGYLLESRETFQRLKAVHRLAEYEKIINEQDIYCVTFDEELLNEDSIEVLLEIEIWDNVDSELINYYKEPYATIKEFIHVFRDRIIDGYSIDVCENGIETGVIEHLLDK